MSGEKKENGKAMAFFQTIESIILYLDINIHYYRIIYI